MASRSKPPLISITSSSVALHRTVPPTQPVPLQGSQREKSSNNRFARLASSASPRRSARNTQSDKASINMRDGFKTCVSQCICRAQPSQKAKRSRHAFSPPGYESRALATKSGIIRSPKSKRERCILTSSSVEGATYHFSASSPVTLRKISTACARTCWSSSCSLAAKPSRPPCTAKTRWKSDLWWSMNMRPSAGRAACGSPSRGCFTIHA